MKINWPLSAGDFRSGYGGVYVMNAAALYALGVTYTWRGDNGAGVGDDMPSASAPHATWPTRNGFSNGLVSETPIQTTPRLVRVGGRGCGAALLRLYVPRCCAVPVLTSLGPALTRLAAMGRPIIPIQKGNAHRQSLDS